MGTLDTSDTLDTLDTQNIQESSDIPRILSISPRLLKVLSDMREWRIVDIVLVYESFIEGEINKFPKEKRLYLASLYLKSAAFYWNSDWKERWNKTSDSVEDFIRRTLKVLDLEDNEILQKIKAKDIVEAWSKISKPGIVWIIGAMDNAENPMAKTLLEELFNKYSTFKKMEK